MRTVLLIICTTLLGCESTSLPVDVTRYVEEREACDHFRGEVPDPPEPQRMQEVSQMLDRYCKGTDARLAELRSRYRASAAVTAKLAAFETTIEIRRK
jgi:hypothetical protein